MKFKSKTKEEKEMKRDIRICVLHRGWVLVGDYSRTGDYVKLEKPSVIRIWGTTKGLGQIAADGPLQNTVLDPEPECEFNVQQVIRTISCSGEKWEKWLK